MVAKCHWVSAFIDVPPARFDDAVAFWSAATATLVSEPRGEASQFVTLMPSKADAHLRMQRLDGPARIHLDLHVSSLGSVAERVVALGGCVLDERDYVIAESPGGLVFCLVGHHGEHDRGPRLADPVPHRQDVVVVDAPAAHFEAEVSFWSSITGEPAVKSVEFEDLSEYIGIPLRHQGMALNLLVQQLGADDARSKTSAHLDISAGSGFRSVVERHVALGAIVERELEQWTVLRDPGGLVYCITDRNPD